MNTIKVNKVVSKVNDKAMVFSAVATAMLLTSPAMAASGSFTNKINADRAASKSMVAGSGEGAAETGLASIYDFIKWVAIVIGLVLAISGLLYVSKASKSEGQKSQMPGWITFGIGGLMTVVGIFMFAVGKTAVSVIGADGNAAANG